MWETMLWGLLVLFVAVAALQPFLASETSRGTTEEPALSTEWILEMRYALGLERLRGQWSDDALDAGIGPLAAAPATSTAERFARMIALDAVDPAAARAELESLRDEAADGMPLAEDLAAFESVFAAPPRPVDNVTEQRLLERYGWFGELALSRLEGDASPRRVEMLASTDRMARLLTAVGSALAALLVLGCGLLTVAVVRWRRGELQSAYRVSTIGASPRRVPFLETLLLFLYGLQIVAALALLIFGERLGTAAQLVVLAILPALLWPVVRGHDLRETLRGLGWQRGRGLVREAGAGVVVYVATLPALALGLGMTLWLSSTFDLAPSHPIVDWLRDPSLTDLVVVTLLAAVWAPIAEETVFRGAFFHYLRGRFGAWSSAAVSAFVFAAIHPQGVAAWPVLGALAIGLAAAREWRGSSIAAIVMHALHNGLALLLLLSLSAGTVGGL